MLEASRQFGMTPMAFLRRVLPAPASGILPAVAACLLFRTWYPPASVVAVLVEGAIVGHIYLAAVLVFGFDRAIRARYAGYLRHVLAPPREAVRHHVAEAS